MTLQKGLVGHWTMDDRDTHSGILYDRSAYDITGSLNGGITTGQLSVIGNSYSFDGVDGAVDLANPDHLEPDSISVSVWMKLNSVNSNYAGIVDNTYSSSYSIMQDSGDAEINWYITSSTGDGPSIRDISTPTGEWVHIVGTYDHTTGDIRVFRNGIYENHDTISANPLGTTSNNILIGNSNTHTYADVDISDVRIYNRPLSESEANQLYNMRSSQHHTSTLKTNLVAHWTMDDRDTQNSELADRSANNNTLALNSGITTGDNGIIDESYSYSGSSSTSATKYEPTPITISAWINPDNDTDDMRYGRLAYSNSNNRGMLLRYNGGSVQTLHGDGSTIVYTDAGTLNVSSNWTHVVSKVAGNGNSEIWVNGTLEDSNASAGLNWGAGGTWEIPEDSRYTGNIDDFRIYNRLLSEDDIDRLYNMRN